MKSDETWHHGVIAATCDVYRECRYLEIGVSAGACLKAVAPHTAYAKGVDPAPPADVGVARFEQTTSDSFFRGDVGEFDVIFLDGDHALEQATRDFENALEALAFAGVIYLHDVFPLSEVDTRERVACGGVYRLGHEIRQDERFETFLWSRFPGLLAVRRRDETIHESSVVP